MLYICPEPFRSAQRIDAPIRTTHKFLLRIASTQMDSPRISREIGLFLVLREVLLSSVDI